MVGVHQCTVHQKGVPSKFSARYYAVVILGGGSIVALHNTVISQGDTYSGLVLGLIVILAGFILPLFTTKEVYSKSGVADVSKYERQELSESATKQSSEDSEPLSTSWDLPL